MSEILKSLNESQRAATVHTGGAAVVLAGAGSGKTRVLTSRVWWLISQQQIDPHQIMVVTFTNKAAKEMVDRIHALTGQRLLRAGTFHSLCARLLRVDGYHIGLESDFIIYDTDDQKKLLKQIYSQHEIDPKQYPVKAVHQKISNAKNELISPESYAGFAQGQFQEQTAHIYSLYQNQLLKNQAVDFDDLLVKTVELLQNIDSVRHKYQQQIEHLLVDEYQDTNKAQYVFTKLLAAPQNNLFAVGDFSQSIYSWRGADYRNMQLLQQDYPDITEYRLEQNYRSHQTILSAASQLIANNTQHPVLELWTDSPAKDNIQLYGASDAYDEARFIASQIRTARNDTPLNEMAILYRTNAQSRVFEDVLLEYGLPYTIVGGTNFYERAEIKDLLAYLKYFHNPLDSVSLERIQKLGKRRLQKFNTLVEKQTLNSASPQELITQILDTTDYLKKYSKDTEEHLQRRANIAELVSVSGQFESTSELLENISLVQNNELRDGFAQRSNEQLQLMSLHTAKGLEFEHVFIVGLENGLLPHSRALYEPTQLEEERRLCYVGMTRAKAKLTLSYAVQRSQYGSTNSATPSRFISEVSPDLFDTHGLASQLRPTQRRVVSIDDDLFEGILAGEIDVQSLIDS